MSLIIAYCGSKGCVVGADKRRIAYFGDKEQREILEKEIYSGKLKTDQEVQNRAKQLNITLKFTEDAKKLKSIGNVLIGEVTTRTPFETKRKKIYVTTNAYKKIELLGSQITHSEEGGPSIIIFGNKISKKLANESLQKRWKENTSLRYIEDIIEEIFKDVSQQTPSVGNQWDIMIKRPKQNKKQAIQLLEKTAEQDIKALNKFRQTLTKELEQINENIQMVEKILNEGTVGTVIKVNSNQVEAKLAKNIEAYDIKWKPLAKPGEHILLLKEDKAQIQPGDIVIIENETLCIQRTKDPLNCDLVICKTEK